MPAGVATRKANPGVSRLAVQTPAGTVMTEVSWPATDENDVTLAGAGMTRKRFTTGALAVNIPNVTAKPLLRIGADAPVVKLGATANTPSEMLTTPALIVTVAAGGSTSGLRTGFGATLDIVT